MSLMSYVSQSWITKWLALLESITEALDQQFVKTSKLSIFFSLVTLAQKHLNLLQIHRNNLYCTHYMTSLKLVILRQSMLMLV